MDTIIGERNIDERTVVSVEKNSPADIAGISVGDIIISVNGEEIHDELDWRFYTADEEFLEVAILRDGREISIFLEPKGDDVGIQLSPLKVRSCGNRCVFCFIDQLPKNLRKSLYFKDGDFRLSFLYGNYITMTNLTETDWSRIIEQRISPLYVSVHSTDEDVRKRLLGNYKIPQILEQLERLSKNRIQFHAQIVLVPGYNDGDVLKRTVMDLLRFYPNILSLAVVPVGLTGHRKNLTHLEPVSAELASDIIDWHYELRDSDERARKILQLADEFFLLANRDIPNSDYYRDYPQYENGVGMVRYFLDSIENWDSADIPHSESLRIALITGELFAPILKTSALEKIEKLSNCEVEIIPVANKLFGGYVNVANLLGGQDIIDAVEKFHGEFDLLVLPPRVIDSEGFFLDSISLDEMKRQIDIETISAPENPNYLFETLKHYLM